MPRCPDAQIPSFEPQAPALPKQSHRRPWISILLLLLLLPLPPSHSSPAPSAHTYTRAHTHTRRTLQVADKQRQECDMISSHPRAFPRKDNPNAAEEDRRLDTRNSVRSKTQTRIGQRGLH